MCQLPLLLYESAEVPLFPSLSQQVLIVQFIVSSTLHLSSQQDRFPEAWDLTSSHKFRSGSDMQYAFAYFYFMMSVREEFNLTREFKALDVDMNGSRKSSCWCLYSSILSFPYSGFPI